MGIYRDVFFVIRLVLFYKEGFGNLFDYFNLELVLFRIFFEGNS